MDVEASARQPVFRQQVKKAKITKVDIARVCALSVGPHLSLESAYGGGEFHGMSMNASLSATVRCVSQVMNRDTFGFDA